MKIDYTSHQYKHIKKKETGLNFKTINVTSAQIDEPSLYETDKKTTSDSKTTIQKEKSLVSMSERVKGVD